MTKKTRFLITLFPILFKEAKDEDFPGLLREATQVLEKNLSDNALDDVYIFLERYKNPAKLDESLSSRLAKESGIPEALFKVLSAKQVRYYSGCPVKPNSVVQRPNNKTIVVQKTNGLNDYWEENYLVEIDCSI